MTYLEFTSTLREKLLQGPVNPATVIINYNSYSNLPSPGLRIDDIAILVEDNNIQQLREATAITLKVPALGGSVTVNVDNSINPYRVVERSQQGDYYVYHIDTEAQRPIISIAPTIVDGVETYTTEVVIEPTTAVGTYEYNTYNALIGNTIVDRESSYILYSDRTTTTKETKTSPVNIESILSNRAVHASVQDSLYSDTGWIQGRYEGTKLTTLNNHSTEPFLQGVFFEGAFFGKDVEDTYISGLDESTLGLKQYFFSGKLDSLQYAVEEVGVNVMSGFNSFDLDLYYRTDIVQPPPTPKQLNIGDMFIHRRVVSSPAEDIFLPEIVRLVAPTQEVGSIFPYIMYTNYVDHVDVGFTAKRGYYNTNPAAIAVVSGTTHSLYRIVPTKVYSITGTTIQPLTEGKMRAAGSKAVVHLDQDGFMVSGSGGNGIVVL